MPLPRHGTIDFVRRSAMGRVTVDKHRCVDIRSWKREGLLRDGAMFPLEGFGDWCNSGVNVTIVEACVHFSRWRHGQPLNRGWKIEHVSLAYTRCWLGGQRPWFACPTCLRPSAILYDLESGFACRECGKLTYRSQYYSRFIRRIIARTKDRS